MLISQLEGFLTPTCAHQLCMDAWYWGSIGNHWICTTEFSLYVHEILWDELLYS